MRQPLRLWPGVAAAVLLVMGAIVPCVLPAAAEIGQIAGFVSAVVIVVWWLFFSRARWFERIGALVAMGIALVITRPFIDTSIAGGAMGALGYGLAIPLMGLALVAWAFGTRDFSDGARRASLAAAVILACGFLTSLRTDGIGGGAIVNLHWRWTPTAEERLLAQAEHDPAPPAVASVVDVSEEPETEIPKSEATSDAAPALASSAPTRAAEWPGFRGPERNSIVRGVRIETDWSTSPPVEL